MSKIEDTVSDAAYDPMDGLPPYDYKEIGVVEGTTVFFEESAAFPYPLPNTLC